MRVEDVNRLLKQYESMRKMMKQLRRMEQTGGKGGRGMPFGMGRGGSPFGF